MTDGHQCCYGRLKHIWGSSPWSDLMSGWILVPRTTIACLMIMVNGFPTFLTWTYHVLLLSQYMHTYLYTCICEYILRLILIHLVQKNLDDDDFLLLFCFIFCSPQINLASVDESTGRMTGGFTTYAICGAIRRSLGWNIFFAKDYLSCFVL